MSAVFFFIMILPPPTSTLFPYTTLFRSCPNHQTISIQRKIIFLRTSGWQFPLENYRSEEHTFELQSQSKLVCRLLLEKKKEVGVRTRCREKEPPHRVLRRINAHDRDEYA